MEAENLKRGAENRKPGAGTPEPGAPDQRPTTNSGVTRRWLRRYNKNVLTLQHAPRPRQFASAGMLAALPRVPTPLSGSITVAGPPEPLRKRL